MNADFLGPYNAGVPYTPNLDHFAGESMVFDRHHTEAGMTGIAFASILSGTQADRSGIYRHPAKLPPEAFLISEAYARAGYETFAWTRHGLASPRLGYTQGIPAANTVRLGLRATHPRFLRILDRVRSDPSYRAFIFTNFTVTHAPYRDGFFDSFLREYGEGGRGMGSDERRFVELYRGDHLALSWNLPEAIERLGLDEAGFARFVEAIDALYASDVNHLDRIFGAVIEAFDLSQDPEERRDLFDPSVPEHSEMAQQLRSYRKRMIEAYTAGTASGSEALIPVSDEVEALRNLGYIE